MKNPSLEQRYPPGCHDPDWCRGNGCWWKCWCAGDEFCDCAECKAFYARPGIEVIPPVEHYVCPNQRGAEPCDCPACQQTNVRIISLDELNRLYPPKETA